MREKSKKQANKSEKKARTTACRRNGPSEGNQGWVLRPLQQSKMENR